MSEKWWDMSDDELDDLFREASDKVDVPFDSSAYNKFRQKIAEQPKSEPPKGFKKRWLLLLVGLFLMVGVGLVYRFGNDLRENNSTVITKNIDTENKVNPLNIPSIISSKINESKDSELSKSEKLVNKVEISSLQKENIIEKSKTPSPLSVSPQTTGGNTTKAKNVIQNSKFPLSFNNDINVEENLTKSSVRTQTTTKENLTKSSVQTQTTIEKDLIESSLHSQTTAEEQNKTSESSYFDSKNNKKQLYRFNNSKNNKDREGKNYPINPQIIGQNTLPIIENLSDIPEKIVVKETINKTNFYDVDFLKNKDSKSLLTDIHTELPDYVDSLPRTIKPLKFSKFGLRLVLSPDFNSIENLGKMALGGSVGLLFEYKISKKLVVQTGMTYSKKSYIGDFGYYHNWSDWKNYHPSRPTEVDGGCKVIDVPINLRLNLFQKPNQTWFVSSGISSYWMVNESYTYMYAWSPSKTADWSDDSKYYFSVLNFSVGLERQISKRFSLQVEPYLKTPLKNVGRGGVNLYSSGVLFSTKYEF
jgi:hypothetical protein